MKKILTAGLITAGCLSPAFADEVGDPNALLTHGLSAGVSFFTMSDEESQAFTPASAYSECIHAEIGETYCARIAAADECSNIDEDVDMNDVCSRCAIWSGESGGRACAAATHKMPPRANETPRK